MRSGTEGENCSFEAATSVTSISLNHLSEGVCVLELVNLRKVYSGIPVVEEISFTARAGEITGYLGANGSGKSTTMKMVTGLIEPSGGVVRFDGKPILDDLMSFRRRVGYVPEEPHLYTHLSGMEYLVMVGQLRGMPGEAANRKIKGLLHSFGLYEDRDVSISSYSKGMRQKVLLSAALLHNPELVLLDEPFSGLDVGSSLVLRSLIEELAARGKVVLFSSHELETVEKISHRIVILHKGKIVADDSIAHLRELMSLPTLEKIFSQLAVEVDAGAIAREITELIHD
jgi:ABC-2 type transport system ATP-binding protein